MLRSCAMQCKLFPANRQDFCPKSTLSTSNPHCRLLVGTSQALRTVFRHPRAPSLRSTAFLLLNSRLRVALRIHCLLDLFRSVLFARGSDASRSQNQRPGARKFGRILLSSFLTQHCSSARSGVTSGVRGLSAPERNAQTTRGVNGGCGGKCQFLQAKSCFSKISWLAPSAEPTRRPEVVPPFQAENLCNGVNGA